MLSYLTSEEPSWFHNLLTIDDLDILFPIRAKFLRQLCSLAEIKRAILNDGSLSASERDKKLAELKLNIDGGHECSLDDLGLTFQLNPTSSIYGYSHVNLITGNLQLALFVIVT